MIYSEYSLLNFKIPVEAEDYAECSDYAIKAIQEIMEQAIQSGNNKILINTNLKLGLPMENILLGHLSKRGLKRFSLKSHRARINGIL